MSSSTSTSAPQLRTLLKNPDPWTQSLAAEALAGLGIEDCERRIDIKGYLFEPNTGMTPPDGYNPDAPMQRWYELDAFTALPPLPEGWLGWQKIAARCLRGRRGGAAALLRYTESLAAFAAIMMRSHLDGR